MPSAWSPDHHPEHRVPTSQEAAAPPDAAPQRGWIRTVYLYLLALLGILLLAIGGVQLLDMGLRALVFPQAEEEERLGYRQPPMPFALERAERVAQGEETGLSPDERAAVRQWIADYRQWKERADRIDPVVSRRQRTASSALALILIGLPLYLYHWALIRRESRRA